MKKSSSKKIRAISSVIDDLRLNEPIDTGTQLEDAMGNIFEVTRSNWFYHKNSVPKSSNFRMKLISGRGVLKGKEGLVYSWTRGAWKKMVSKTEDSKLDKVDRMMQKMGYEL